MIRDPSTWGSGRDARAPLIGREAEMAALDEAAKAVLGQREARIVSLIGPAGVGKSRLIQDFVKGLRAAGTASRLGSAEAGAASKPTLRVYRGSARDGGPAFGLFARLLRARFGLVEGMAQDIAKDQVRAQVADVLEDRKVGDVVYFLGQFLGISWEESPLTKAVSEDPHEAALVRRAVFKAFLEADAEHGPMCLVLEDLHAAHDDALALLRYLLEYLSAPILVICAARPDLLSRHEDWARAGEARHRLIELPLLSEEAATAMMQALLAPCEGGAPAQLVEAACAFAGGSPLLLEQMVRIYHDKGVLQEEENDLSDEPKWIVNLEKLASVELPLTIDDAVTARIAALEPGELAILEQAAAMGSVFWSGAFLVLSRMGREAPELWTVQPVAPDTTGTETIDDLPQEYLEDDDSALTEDNSQLATMLVPRRVVSGEDAAALAATLGDLVERDYILRLPDSTFPGSEEYIFKHNREREAIARRTRPTAQKRYHQGIADWMDHQKALRTGEEYIAMLAEHREKSGDALRGGLAYLEAGDVARARYAPAKAAEYYEKGLDLLGDSYVGRRIQALHDYGDVLFLAGKLDDALAAFREMLTLAYRLDLREKGGAAHNRIGRLYRDTGALDEAGKHLATAMALFEAAGDERGVASTTDDIGKLHWLKGEYPQALVALRDGLTRRRKLKDRRSIALSLNNLGLALQDSGKFKEALDAFDQALSIRREIGDLVGVGATLNNLGTIAQDQRDFGTALAFFGEALDVCKQVGDRNRIAMVLTNIGEVHYRSGNPAEAIKVLEQAEGLCDELGDKLGLAETLRGLGKAYLLKGDLAKARDCIGRAVDLFAAVRSKVHLGVALRTLGEITAAGGWGSAHTRSAREYFARAVTIFEQTGNEVELARTYKVYSRFLKRQEAQQVGGLTETVEMLPADAMNAKADAIFARLQIPIEVASPRSLRPGSIPDV